MLSARTFSCATWILKSPRFNRLCKKSCKKSYERVLTKWKSTYQSSEPAMCESQRHRIDMRAHLIALGSQATHYLEQIKPLRTQLKSYQRHSVHLPPRKASSSLLLGLLLEPQMTEYGTSLGSQKLRKALMEWHIRTLSNWSKPNKS